MMGTCPDMCNVTVMATVPNPVCPICQTAPDNVELMVRAIVAFRSSRRSWGGAARKRIPICRECYAKRNTRLESPDGLTQFVSAHWTKGIEIECDVCRLPVEVDVDPRRKVDVCSDLCRSRYYKLERPVRPSVTCDVCGNTFAGRADARYCSPKCRQKAYRTRAAQ